MYRHRHLSDQKLKDERNVCVEEVPNTLCMTYVLPPGGCLSQDPI